MAEEAPEAADAKATARKKKVADRVAGLEAAVARGLASDDDTLKADLERRRLQQAARGDAPEIAAAGVAWGLHKHSAKMTAKAIAAAIESSMVLAEHIGKLSKRLDALESKHEGSAPAQLEKRIAALELMPSLQYRGVYSHGQDYPAGSAVTDKGGIWIALSATTERPGAEGSTAWRLACKKGADGRDGQKGDQGPRGLDGRSR